MFRGYLAIFCFLFIYYKSLAFSYKINFFERLLTLYSKRCIMFIVICECAGIGRQARLRGVCRKTYGFKSHYSHHSGQMAELV